MTIRTNNLAILYADIDCGPEVKKTLGEWIANQRVAQMISIISEAICKQNGIVSKTFEDRVLGTFTTADAAFNAARQIQKSQISLSKTITGNLGLDIRISLNIGKMIVVAGNISGDELNLAMHLVTKAKAGGVVLTSTFKDGLSKNLQAKVKGIGKSTIEALNMEVDTYEILLDGAAKSSSKQKASTGSKSAKSQPAVKKEPAKPSSTHKDDRTFSAGSDVTLPPQTETNEKYLEIKYKNNVHKIYKDMPKFSIGRGTGNNLIINVPYISRKHAEIEYQGGHFVVNNLGGNGTYIKTSNSIDEMFCDGKSEIVGSGNLSMGCPIAEDKGYLIHYKICDD